MSDHLDGKKAGVDLGLRRGIIPNALYTSPNLSVYMYIFAQTLSSSRSILYITRTYLLHDYIPSPVLFLKINIPCITAATNDRPRFNIPQSWDTMTECSQDKPLARLLPVSLSFLPAHETFAVHLCNML